MKKALLLVSVLFISVVSTACINKFAVQELNNKAKGYIEQGDYQNAIERLKSSVDLDDTVFETHYNLAVAYTQAEDYPNAIASYKKAIEINPDFADAYYSLAVAEEDFSVDLAKGVLKLDENGNPVKVDEKELEKQEKITITPEAEKLINDLLTEAVNNYTIYLQKGADIQDGDEVKEKIERLNEEKAGNQAPQTNTAG
ncbi:tetratricopeptide repeat protein [bacterium]|uniref:Tetratricopeptide repeat protein n=1 Tax=Candidatus Scatenecus faecavium TaxID=2840915 RepID=A0A9D1FX96_9BACT|nr:tetratricopeptide repeat protein [bacterium]HIS83735.1 tetratricopeptide repeat protein [Candidatus Scatenecus faecavium]